MESGEEVRIWSEMSGQSIFDLFEAACGSFADRPALLLESGECFSFRQLDDLSRRLAESLLPAIHAGLAGLQPSETPLVCVMMHRHASLVVGLLAVLRCGAAFVPVDPSFPPERQSYILGHSRCLLLLVDETCVEAAKDLGAEMPTLVVSSATSEVIASTMATVPHAGSTAQMRALSRRREDGGLMYVLYTSGSTGRPKGVMVKNRGVVNTVSWFTRELQLGTGSRVLGLTTTCFDISMLEIFMPLISGGTLVFASSASQKNPFRLLELLRSCQVSVFQATPTTYEMMMATGWCGDAGIDFLVGGEAFRSTLLPLLGRCRSLRNVYGPTETTIWSSSYTLPRTNAEIPGHLSGTRVSVPIGMPISATQFYLVDSTNGVITQQPEEGELWIGGASVAAGYLNAPDLTASRFLPNPFGTGVVYRTGDWVRRLPCGNFVFDRRLDDQVKIDGYRIELEEIENVYSSHAMVDQAVAVVRDNKLMLFFKATQGRTMTNDDIRMIDEFASRSLTHYMMPKYIDREFPLTFEPFFRYTIQVRAFPLTANGKLDRNAFPSPEIPSVADASLKPLLHGSDSSKTMADHICDVMEAIKGKRPQVNANFSSIGVDSLGAVLFIRSLSESLGGIQIEPSKIYSPQTTIVGLAEEMYHQLSIENPSLLSKLRITGGADDAEIDNTDDYAKSAVEMDLEEGFLTNRKLYDGLRGILTIMVLWDHYHPDNMPTVDSFQSDTLLFVVLSGFTAAVQLRDPPRRSVKKSGFIVESRGNFDWKAYLVGRAVGIFPILWVALVVNIPFWIYQDTAVVQMRIYSSDQALQCIPLYITGIQSLFRPQCKHLGPNTTVYASLIWTVFILYGILRSYLTSFQNYIMKWATIDTGKKGMRSFIGHCAMMVAYNRPCPSVATAIIFFWFVFLTFSFTLLWRYMGWKTCFMYISYFVGGAAGASIVESTHWASWNRHLSVYKWTPLDLFPSESSAPPECQLSTDVEEGNPVPSKTRLTYFKKLAFGSWRHLPDAIIVLSIILLFVDFPWSYQTARMITWIVMPQLMILFLIVVTLQRGAAKVNFSRWILESSLLNFIGYLSYPICKSVPSRIDVSKLLFLDLIQRVVFDFYAPMLSRDVHEHRKFNRSSVVTQAGFLLMLIAFCWLLQKYVQDTFVAWLYSSFITSRRKIKK